MNWDIFFTAIYNFILWFKPKSRAKVKQYEAELAEQIIKHIQQIYLKIGGASSVSFALLENHGQDKITILYEYPTFRLDFISRIKGIPAISFGEWYPLLIRNGVYLRKDVNTITDSGLKSFLLKDNINGVMSVGLKDKNNVLHAVVSVYTDLPNCLKPEDLDYMYYNSKLINGLLSQIKNPTVLKLKKMLV